MNLQDRQSSPFYKPPLKVADIMRGVIFALLPGFVTMFVMFGWGVLINVILCIIFSLAFESISLYLRKRPIRLFLGDMSAVLTAILLGLALPPLVPWWIVLLGSFFAIMISKQLYGGIGYNVFNPAMVAYAILIISFPSHMTTLWQGSLLIENMPHLNFYQSIQWSFNGSLPQGITLDALTAATPLNSVKTALSSGTHSISELKALGNVFGDFSGHSTEWVNLAFFVSGLLMIYLRFISWHIPIAILTSLLICSTVFGVFVDADANPSPLFHLFSGATMLGAFFIATDPVTASTTAKGKLIFGAGIGFLLYVIRTWGGYPDAIAFSVIFMNLMVPSIDYYTQPRVFGHDK